MPVPKTWKSSTIIRSLQMAKKLPPIHPGEILREEFLVPLKLTSYAVAAALHVPRTRIERIAREEKPITADTALRLGKFFKTGAAFWMNIHARYHLETAEDVLAPQIQKITSYKAAGERCSPPRADYRFGPIRPARCEN